MTMRGLISQFVRRVADAQEDVAFSHDPEFVRSLDESDERLRAGDVGTVEDLERELSDPAAAERPHPIAH